MAYIELPVSYGEAFDKLSILSIKLQKISDAAKRNKARIEFDLILAKLHQYFDQYPTCNELYQQLCYINGLLWDVEDRLREMETAKTTHAENFIQRAREVYLLNDRRAEIKRLIDGLLNSHIQEVKSYSPYKRGKLLILGHLGLGDMIIMNGLIRYKALFYEEVRVVTFSRYVASVKFMFRDLNNVTFEEIGVEADISPNYAGRMPARLLELLGAGYEFLPLGNHGTEPMWQMRGYDFAESFYIQAGVAYEVRTRFGWVMRDLAAEEDLYKRIVGCIGMGYRVIQDDPNRQLVIDRTHPVFGKQKDLPLFHVATRELVNGAGETVNVWSNNIFDYLTLIDRAAEFHGMDSSFMLMLDLCRSKCRAPVIHSYVKADVHAKLYPSLAAIFIGPADRILRPFRAAVIEKAGSADLLIQTIRELYQQKPELTHIVAIDARYALGVDLENFLTVQEPFVWSDFARIATNADETMIVFATHKLRDIGGPAYGATTWRFTKNPLVRR